MGVPVNKSRFRALKLSIDCHRIELKLLIAWASSRTCKTNPKRGRRSGVRVFINRKESKKRQKKKHDGKGKEKIKRVRRLVSFEYRGRTYHVRVPHSYQERQAEVHSSRSLNPTHQINMYSHEFIYCTTRTMNSQERRLKYFSSCTSI